MSSTYGFIGSGITPAKNATALIKDLVGGDTDARFIIPVSQSTWTDTIDTIANFAMDNNLPIEVVTDDTAEENKAFATVIQSAEKIHRVTKVPMKVVNLLEKNDGSALIMAWNDEDADALKALERALSKNIPASDLTNGLEPIEFEDDSEDEDPQAILDTIGGNAVNEVEEDEPEVEFTEDDEGFASPLDAETDEFDEDDTPMALMGDETSSQNGPETFDNTEDDAETLSSSSDTTEDATSSEDDTMSTATQARQVAHPFPPAATPEDFESSYSLDVSADEILAQAMDIMCDRIAARVLAVTMPRLDSIERFMASQGHSTPRPAAVKTPTQQKRSVPTPAKTEAKAATPKKSTATKTGTEATIDLGHLRAWARENGYEVGERGRIKQEIKDAYMKANK